MNKEFIDQPAHVLVAAGLVAAFVVPTPLWLAVLIVLIGAYIRELLQHDWDWRRVGWFDLTFIATGAASAALFFWVSA